MFKRSGELDNAEGGSKRPATTGRASAAPPLSEIVIDENVKREFYPPAGFYLPRPEEDDSLSAGSEGQGEFYDEDHDNENRPPPGRHTSSGAVPRVAPLAATAARPSLQCVPTETVTRPTTLAEMFRLNNARQVPRAEFAARRPQPPPTPTVEGVSMGMMQLGGRQGTPQPRLSDAMTREINYVDVATNEEDDVYVVEPQVECVDLSGEDRDVEGGDRPSRVDALPISVPRTRYSAPPVVPVQNRPRCAVRPPGVPFTADSLRKSFDRYGSEHVDLLPNYGRVLDCNFIGYILGVMQDRYVSFYQQSGFGKLLESQCKWIPLGGIARKQFDNSYVRKSADEYMICVGGSGSACVEIYCKERPNGNHEMPVCEVLAVLYFRRTDSGVRCKVHQLEKFIGLAETVRFVVVQRANCITMYYESWLEVGSDSSRVLNMTSYFLSDDFIFVRSAYEHQRPVHQLTALDTIDNCDKVVAGSGFGFITLWASQVLMKTVNMTLSLRPIHFTCDRGCYFALQEEVAYPGALRLVSVDATSYVFQALRSFCPPQDYGRLQYATIIDGEVVAFYENGRVCWDTETGGMLACVCESPRDTGRMVSRPHGPWWLHNNGNRILVRRLWKALRRCSGCTLKN